MKNLSDLKVVFAGCAKNCEKYLPKVLKNIDDYKKLFKSTYTLIVENGSKDKSKEILSTYKSENNLIFFKDEFEDQPYRGKRLELARNFIIEKIKNLNYLSSCDLLIILDFDNRSLFKINNNNIKKAVNFLLSDKKIAGVFSNQPGTYYDMWGLLDDNYCKNDFWVEALNFATKKMSSKQKIDIRILSDLRLNFLNKKKFQFPLNSDPYEVRSAYGGFGIYKISHVLQNKNKYLGTQNISVKFKDISFEKIEYQKNEIVNFNKGFADLELKLFILPYLINSDLKDVNFIPEAAFRFIINKKKLSIF